MGSFSEELSLEDVVKIEYSSALSSLTQLPLISLKKKNLHEKRVFADSIIKAPETLRKTAWPGDCVTDNVLRPGSTAC